MSYASASAPPGSAANLSAHSGSGAVNGWCTEVQPPSPFSSNIGASTTHTNDQAAALADLQPGRTEQLAGGRRGAGREEHAVTRAGARRRGQAGPFGLRQV